jgi:putative aldouronate transport system substrate-binding protein
MRAKGLAALSIVLIAATVLAGCGASQSAPSSNIGDNTAKKLKIEYMGTAKEATLPADDQNIIKQQIDQKLNIDLQMNLSPDYDNKINVRVAASDFPDIFPVGKAQLSQFASQGALLDLTPYADKLKNVQQYLGDFWNAGKSGGKMYYIPGLPGMSDRYFTYWIRTDWLDKLHLKPPSTLDELVQVSKAFTFNDPDGNGKKDTYGITGPGLAAFAPIFGAYGVPLGRYDQTKDELYVENGKAMDSLQEKGMKEALTFVNSLVTAGVVDPELVANKSADVQKKAFQGQEGIVFIDWASMTKDEFVKQYQTVNPNAKWVQLPAIQGPYGKSNNAWDASTGSGGIALPKTLEKDPAKLNRVLQLLDYMGSPEGSRLSMFGVEGRDYNLKEGKVVPTDQLAKEGSYFFIYQLFGRDDQQYLYSKFLNQIPYIDKAFAEPHTKVFTKEVDLPPGYNSADASRYVMEELVKFVYGKEPIGNYDSFLNTLKSTYHQDLLWKSAEMHFKDKDLLK